jgi:hypothetical protein
MHFFLYLCIRILPFNFKNAVYENKSFDYQRISETPVRYYLDWFATLLACRNMALLAGMAADYLAVCTYDLHGYLATDFYA